MSKPNVDGLLIGGASLVGSEFAKIVRIAAKAKE
jgi:triosephosphate isomerase